MERIIPINAAGSNNIVRNLIFPLLFPESTDIRAEISLSSIIDIRSDEKKEKSRFDFKFCLNDRIHLVEVKSCTLTEQGVAMFPDAPTIRGRRHVEELTELQQSGLFECHVIIVLHHGDTRLFIPNYHTDPEFAFTLRKANTFLNIHAVSVETDRRGFVRVSNPKIPLDFAPVQAARDNMGFFILVFNIEKSPLTVRDENYFITGWYVFIIDSESALRETMNRHLNRKNLDENLISIINYQSSARKGIPVYCDPELGNRFRKDLSGFSDRSPAGEEKEQEYLYFKKNPLQNSDFTNLLFLYRHKKALVGKS